jgi:hypothetical protein
MQLPEKSLAIGFTAELFAWKEGWVLKLFKPGKPPDGGKRSVAGRGWCRPAGYPCPMLGEWWRSMGGLD